MEIRWQTYGVGRNTGVRAFALLPEAIALQFHDGSTYLYDEQRPGPEHVAKMRALATCGAGLTTYVNRHVRENVAGKIAGSLNTR